jgi:hypothetical protein
MHLWVEPAGGGWGAESGKSLAFGGKRILWFTLTLKGPGKLTSLISAMPCFLLSIPPLMHLWVEPAGGGWGAESVKSLVFGGKPIHWFTLTLKTLLQNWLHQKVTFFKPRKIHRNYKNLWFEMCVYFPRCPYGYGNFPNCIFYLIGQPSFLGIVRPIE